MSERARRGFTLVELLVVVVLGTLVVLVASTVLVTNTRIHTVSNAQIQGRQIMRAGVDVLFGELREISVDGEDLGVMGTDRLEIRSQRAFGLVCDTDYSSSPGRLTVVRVGSWFAAGDSIFVFADNDPERTSDDAWLARTIQSVDLTATCGGREAQVLTFPTLPPRATRSGWVPRFVPSTGSPTDLSSSTGRPTWAGRPGAPPARTPWWAPSFPSGGVVFRYLDAREQVTTVPTEVSQIEVTLRFQSEARRVGGDRVSDSIVTRIYPRN
jgi:prepilin-type N-terminal cleavage/methylation domain-containing protein